MWRFIVISFAFLGFSFYELSGGSDYKPATNSIQVRGQLNNERPKMRPAKVAVTKLAANGAPFAEETVTRSMTSLSDLDLSNGQRFEIRLARVVSPAKTKPAEVTQHVAKNRASVETSEATLPDHVAKAVASASLAGSVADSVDQATLASTSDPEVDLPDRDIRRVTGTVVNLRGGPGTKYDRIAKLRRNDEVTVLQDLGNGWIKLRVVQTGRVGWMADWLVTASN